MRFVLDLLGFNFLTGVKLLTLIDLEALRLSKSISLVVLKVLLSSLSEMLKVSLILKAVEFLLMVRLLVNLIGEL